MAAEGKESLETAKTEQTRESGSLEMKSGTVTFLDVLGWKGIWLRRNSSEVVEQLQKLVDLAVRVARGADETRVLSISDTIVLLTEGDGVKGVTLHGQIVAELICESIIYGLPLRGATACGRFFHELPSILVGAAVDEAASWHEATEWIGVVQTPSAFLTHDGVGRWRRYVAPVKTPGKFEIPCVDWPAEWRGRGFKKGDLRREFAAMGPFDTVVAAKYTNTLSFYGDDP